MNIQKYVTRNKIILSTDEVRELFNNFEKNKEIIVKSQLPLVLNLATSFSLTTGYSIEDLFSVGMESLSFSANNYDNDSKATFTTYCKTLIKWEMSHYQNNLIRIPNNRKKNENNPKARVFSSYSNNSDRYFEDTIVDDSKIIVDTESELIKLIKITLNDEVNSDILCSHLSLGKNKRLKYKEIGDIHGVSTETVRLIVVKSMKLLKNNGLFINNLKLLYNLD